jgi:hypothetical protein
MNWQPAAPLWGWSSHGLAGLAGARSLGAVRDSTVTPTAITANARTATAIFAGLSVKRSSNSQTLKMMLANGGVERLP